MAVLASLPKCVHCGLVSKQSICNRCAQFLSLAKREYQPFCEAIAILDDRRQQSSKEEYFKQNSLDAMMIFLNDCIIMLRHYPDHQLAIRAIRARFASLRSS